MAYSTGERRRTADTDAWPNVLPNYASRGWQEDFPCTETPLWSTCGASTTQQLASWSITSGLSASRGPGTPQLRPRESASPGWDEAVSPWDSSGQKPGSWDHLIDRGQGWNEQPIWGSIESTQAPQSGWPAPTASGTDWPGPQRTSWDEQQRPVQLPTEQHTFETRSSQGQRSEQSATRESATLCNCASSDTLAGGGWAWGGPNTIGRDERSQDFEGVAPACRFQEVGRQNRSSRARRKRAKQRVQQALELKRQQLMIWQQDQELQRQEPPSLGDVSIQASQSLLRSQPLRDAIRELPWVREPEEAPSLHGTTAASPGWQDVQAWGNEWVAPSPSREEVARSLREYNVFAEPDYWSDQEASLSDGFGRTHFMHEKSEHSPWCPVEQVEDF